MALNKSDVNTKKETKTDVKALSEKLGCPVVEAADRKRFAFANKIVAKVETRKVLTKDKNTQDKIDAVRINPVAGLVIFAGVMFLVFQISQAWVGHWIADLLVGWIEIFQEWVGGLTENANRFAG